MTQFKACAHDTRAATARSRADTRWPQPRAGRNKGQCGLSSVAMMGGRSPDDFTSLVTLSPAPHADTQSPQPHAAQECQHYHQDQQSSAPPAKCDASIAPTTATDQSHSPASPDHPAQAGTLHSFPIDRDAHCNVLRVAFEFHAHGSRAHAPHRCTRPAAHRAAIPPAAIAALPHADRYARAVALKSSRDSAGSLQDDSGIVPMDHQPSHKGIEALPFCHTCGYAVSH